MTLNEAIRNIESVKQTEFGIMDAEPAITILEEYKRNLSYLEDYARVFLEKWGIDIEILLGIKKEYSREEWGRFHEVLAKARNEAGTGSDLDVLYRMGYWEAVKDRTRTLASGGKS